MSKKTAPQNLRKEVERLTKEVKKWEDCAEVAMKTAEGCVSDANKARLERDAAYLEAYEQRKRADLAESKVNQLQKHVTMYEETLEIVRLAVKRHEPRPTTSPTSPTPGSVDTQ